MARHALGPDHSLKKEIAVLLSLVGTALGLVGLVATAWARPATHRDTNPVREIGLWRYCKYVDPEDTTPQECFSIHDTHVPGWFRAVQMLCVAGFCVQFVTMVLTVVSECALTCRGNMPLVYAFVTTGCMSSIFVASALIIFGSEIEDSTFASLPSNDGSNQMFTYNIAWAFIITGFGAGIQPICAVLGLWDACAKNKKSTHLRIHSVQENTPQGNHPYGSMVP